VANIIGPQTYQAKDAPGYLPAKITVLAVVAAAMLVVCVLRIFYGFRNRSASKTITEGLTVAGEDGKKFVYSY